MFKKPKKILLIKTSYYPDISNGLQVSAIEKINEHLKYLPCSIDTIVVPGVFEIPVTIVKNIKKYDGFLALGCVIKGETPHFDFISQATTAAIMNISVEFKKPVGNGIITCLNMKQAVARKAKGAEAASAVLCVFGPILQKR